MCGDEVVGLDNFDPFYERVRKERNLGALRGRAGFVLHEGDLLDAGLLARVLESIVGEKVTADNLYVGFRDGAAASEAAIRTALDELHTAGRPNHADAVRFAEGCARGRLSKFQPCLPERLEAELLAEVLTDEAGARMGIRGGDGLPKT